MALRTQDPTMKTTVELPDTLYHQAKAEAALNGRTFKDLVEEGLRLVLEARPAQRRIRPWRAWCNPRSG
jgi:hypothetical protein